MRNNNEPKIRAIIAKVKSLPYFSLDDISPIEKDRTYLKILCSRYVKSGKLIRLKKGLYVSSEYIGQLEKNNKISSYTEFVSNILYQPSYISLEYVLYEHNILTEIPVCFTLMTRKKTANFSNRFGSFAYHTIQEPLFTGFTIQKENEFFIKKATKAKALFDYLYLRKHILTGPEAFRELRFDTINISASDIQEFHRYSTLEGSKKMMEISRYITSSTS